MELIWIRAKHLYHRLPNIPSYILSQTLNTPILHSSEGGFKPWGSWFVLFLKPYNRGFPFSRHFFFFTKEPLRKVFSKTTTTINWSTEHLFKYNVAHDRCHYLSRTQKRSPDILVDGIYSIKCLSLDFPFVRWAPNLRHFLRSHSALIREIIRFNKIIHLS